ncbi:MAG: HPr family phosphocarrier protein [Acetobacteraceae bacterium]
MSGRGGTGAPPAAGSSATDPTAADPTAADPTGTDPTGTGPAAADPPAPGPPADAAPEAVVLTRRVIVPNRRGLHARAAARLVTTAERFGAAVDIVHNGQSVSARSIMGLMMLGAGPGAALDLRAEGWDAREAVDALAALIESGFDEQD